MVQGLVPYGEDLVEAEDKDRALREKREALQKKRLIRPSRKRAELAKCDEEIERQGDKIMAIEEIVKTNPVSRENYKRIKEEREKERLQEEREL